MWNVECQDAYGRMTRIGVKLVKLILRGKEYEVKPGMNLQAALKKCDILPESVIATRNGEMILDDEILRQRMRLLWAVALAMTEMNYEM